MKSVGDLFTLCHCYLYPCRELPPANFLRRPSLPLNAGMFQQGHSQCTEDAGQSCAKFLVLGYCHCLSMKLLKSLEETLIHGL